MKDQFELWADRDWMERASQSDIVHEADVVGTWRMGIVIAAIANSKAFQPFLARREKIQFFREYNLKGMKTGTHDKRTWGARTDGLLGFAPGPDKFGTPRDCLHVLEGKSGDVLPREVVEVADALHKYNIGSAEVWLSPTSNTVYASNTLKVKYPQDLHGLGYLPNNIKQFYRAATEGGALSNLGECYTSMVGVNESFITKMPTSRECVFTPGYYHERRGTASPEVSALALSLDKLVNEHDVGTPLPGLRPGDRADTLPDTSGKDPLELRWLLDDDGSLCLRDDKYTRDTGYQQTADPAEDSPVAEYRTPVVTRAQARAREVANQQVQANPGGPQEQAVPASPTPTTDATGLEDDYQLLAISDDDDTHAAGPSTPGQPLWTTWGGS